MKKILIFIAVITCTSFVNTATAKTTEGTVYVTCPGGFFCTNNGEYYTTDTTTSSFWGRVTYKIDEIPTYMYGPAELVTPGWGRMGDELFCAVCNGQHDSSCAYCADEYDEVWVSTWFGFYGAKNNDVTNHSWRGSAFAGVFPCPGTHPSSDSGASSVFQCYRTTSNGQKEYYKTPNKTTHNYDGNYNTEDVNALLTNLQSAIDQANSASQNLQAILKKSNNKIKVTSVTGIKQNLNYVATNAQQTNVASIQTTQPGNTPPTNATTTVAPVTMKLSDVKTDSTTSSPLKKLDFGNLSSIFSADKAAVHNTATGRAALPTNPPHVSHIKKSTPGRATTNGATSTPPQTNTAPAPTRANTKTKRIASER